MNKEEYIEHHGILGMKWGVRRYQNKDGTLTATGKMRYNNADSTVTKKVKDYNQFLQNVTQDVIRQKRQPFVEVKNKKSVAKKNRDAAYQVNKETYKQRMNEAMQSGQKDRKTVTRLSIEYGLNIDAINADYQKYMHSYNLSSNRKYQKAKSIVNNNLKVASDTYRLKYDVSTGLYTLEEK